MSQPWRDVYSIELWQSLVSEYQSGKLTSKSKNLGRWFRSIGSSGRVLPQQIQRLTQKLTHYHSIPKTSIGLFKHRRGLLWQMIGDVNEYCQKYKVERKILVPSNRADRDFSSMDAYMYTLGTLARNKAGYLQELERLYAKVYPGLGLDIRKSPRTLIDYLAAPRKLEELCDVQAGTRLEKLDPFHRSFEINVLENGDMHGVMMSAMNYAFGEWAGVINSEGIPTGLKAQQSKPALPFFAWLEAHPICTGATNDVIDAHGMRRVGQVGSVEYARSDTVRVGSGGSERISVLVPSNGILISLRLGGRDFNIPKGIFDTSDPEFAKGKRTLLNSAAYVWSAGGEIFVGAHAEAKFHHTSFVAGEKVRCAGMLQATGGRVTYVSNDSGHYRPDDVVHLKPFVRFLLDQNVFAPNAQIKSIRHGTKSPQQYVNVA